MERRNRVTIAILIVGFAYVSVFLLVMDLDDFGGGIHEELFVWLVLPLIGLTMLERWLHRRML